MSPDTASADVAAFERSRLQALSADAPRAMVIAAVLVIVVGLMAASRMTLRTGWIATGIGLAALALRAWFVVRSGRAAATDLPTARRLEIAAVLLTLACSLDVAWMAGNSLMLPPERQAALGAVVLAGCLGAIATLAASPVMLIAATVPLLAGAAGALTPLRGDPWLLMAYAAFAALLFDTGRRAIGSRRDALRADLQTQALSERQWSVLEAMPAGVALTQGTRLIRASGRLKTWLGADAGSLHDELARATGRSSGRLDRLLSRADARVQGHQVREFELAVRGGSGPRWLGIQLRRLDPLQTAQGLLWTITDRTAEHAQRAGRTVDPLHDPLTGALNRRGLWGTLGPMLARDLDKRPLGVMCLDLNGFKPLNDRYGHAFGDRVLCTVHERLKRALRGTDLIARPGGDEFVIVLDPLDDSRQAATIADRLSDIIAAPMLLEGLPCQVQASIGLAVAPVDGREAGMLIECADRAMHEVKRAISPGPPKPAERSGQDRRSPR